MFRDNLLHPKRILITGGGTGLGKAMATRFLELGATVYICGRREDVLKKTEAELAAHGPIRGDDNFTRVTLDGGATQMRVDVYDRKGGLLDGVALPL